MGIIGAVWAVLVDPLGETSPFIGISSIEKPTGSDGWVKTLDPTYLLPNGSHARPNGQEILWLMRICLFSLTKEFVPLEIGTIPSSESYSNLGYQRMGSNLLLNSNRVSTNSGKTTHDFTCGCLIRCSCISLTLLSKMLLFTSIWNFEWSKELPCPPRWLAAG